MARLRGTAMTMAMRVETRVPIDAAGRPEFLEHRVPFLGKEKAKAESLDRRPGGADQIQPDGQHHQGHQQRAEKGQPAEGPVASAGQT